MNVSCWASSGVFASRAQVGQKTPLRVVAYHGQGVVEEAEEDGMVSDVD